MCVLFICSLCGKVCAQGTATDSVKSVKADESKPTVYLSVERKDKERVWLRMYNNTIWAISVRTYTFHFNRDPGVNLINGKTVFALPSGKEIDSLHYYIEKESIAPSNIRLPEVGYPDSSTISWIPSKGSILFSAPLKQLERGLMIYVPFQYEWELNEQLIYNKEPAHRVYFRGADLTNELQ